MPIWHRREKDSLCVEVSKGFAEGVTFQWNLASSHQREKREGMTFQAGGCEIKCQDTDIWATAWSCSVVGLVHCGKK